MRLQRFQPGNRQKLSGCDLSLGEIRRNFLGLRRRGIGLGGTTGPAQSLPEEKKIDIDGIDLHGVG